VELHDGHHRLAAMLLSGLFKRMSDLPEGTSACSQRHDLLDAFIA